jgi:hypothetical protein
MGTSSLLKKLRIKPGQRILFLNAPPDYAEQLGVVPEGVEVSDRLSGKFDLIQVFAQNTKELQRFGPKAIQALKPEGLIWFSFPKGSSKMQTDLTRDVGWDAIRRPDLKWISLISVNDVWSAFALRKQT